MNNKIFLQKINNILKPQELVGYLNSRLCHDLISPISAINNAIELIEFSGIDDEITDIITLAGKSASYKLQFARLAFGLNSAAQQDLAISEIKDIANNYMATSSSNISWELKWLSHNEHITKENAKLLFNLLIIAKEAASRGGTIIIELSNEDNIEIKINGSKLNDLEKLQQLTSSNLDKSAINSHNIQNYYFLILASESNKIITIEEKDHQLIISCHNKD